MKKFLTLLAVAVLTIHTSSPAQAHLVLVTSTPKNGAMVKSFPRIFSLTFNEEILKFPGKEPSRVQLTAPNQKMIALGKIAISKEVLTVPMSKASVKEGKYRLTYRVVSSDGHVIKGEITFTYKG